MPQPYLLVSDRLRSSISSTRYFHSSIVSSCNMPPAQEESVQLFCKAVSLAERLVRFSLLPFVRRLACNMPATSPAVAEHKRSKGFSQSELTIPSEQRVQLVLFVHRLVLQHARRGAEALVSLVRFTLVWGSRSAQSSRMRQLVQSHSFVHSARWQRAARKVPLRLSYVAHPLIYIHIYIY